MKVKRKSGSFLVVDDETRSFSVKPIAQSRYSLDDISEHSHENPSFSETENECTNSSIIDPSKRVLTQELEVSGENSKHKETRTEHFVDSKQQTDGDSLDLHTSGIPEEQITSESSKSKNRAEPLEVILVPQNENLHDSWRNHNGTSTGLDNHFLITKEPPLSIPERGVSFKEIGPTTVCGTRGFYILGRPRWRSWFLFQLCSLSVLFGLGTTWRFPSLAYENYGGTFVFAYLIAWLLIGLPVLVLEQLVGQFAHKGHWKIWACVPLFKGMAITQCIISAYLLAMFNILVSWFGVYFSLSFSKPLSWNSSLAINGSGYMNMSSAEQYFQSNILNLTDLDSISSMDYRMVLAVLIASVFVVGICVYEMRIFEMVIPILAALILALAIALLAYACLHDGANDGIAYFVTPQWKHLLDSKVWYSAVTQVVYSQSIGLGLHITLSSMNRFEWPVTRYAITTAVISMLFTLFFGLTIFALLGNMASNIHMNVENAVDLGYGLIYIVISDSVSTMALYPQAFSGVIFAVLFICGTMSPAVLVINIVTVTQAQFKWLLKLDWIAVLSLVTLGFLISLVFTTQAGIYFLKIFDAYGVSITALVCLGLETIGFLWIYGLKLLQTDFNMMTTSYTKWVTAVAYLTPVLILVVSVAALAQFDLVRLDGRSMPSWAHGLGAALIFVAILPICVYMIYVTFMQLDYGILRKLQMAARANPSWGPNEFRHRQTWLGHKVESYSTSDNRAIDKVTEDSSREEDIKRDDAENPDAWAMY